MSDGLKIRAEIDNRGHHSILWVASGAAVVVAQFVVALLEAGKSVPIQLAVAEFFFLVAILLALALFYVRRKTSLMFEHYGMTSSPAVEDSTAPEAHGWSKLSWIGWFVAIGSIALGFASLVLFLIVAGLS
ncbi:hypothetical protein [Maricaulis sp.]|uniref:hypothetical protein n=1 Tax=Maricaulis sp. TaxID=1486257 RepID=UPI003A935B28